MLPQEIIRLKRDGAVLTPDQIQAVVNGMVDGGFTDSQISAFAMAVFFRGLSIDERVALTRAMTRSGTVLDWSAANLNGPVLDKHSSGGVGDKVSLMLGPMVAACGGHVPMISGRGLGHTGGTLDKLESIPGYNAVPDLATFQRVVADCGVAIIGQTADLAPADRRFYGIRDVTGTVESLDLITASILSKKLAAGLDALVMDIKCGNGAFADRRASATALADSIIRVATGAGMPTTAIVTDMNQVLGDTAGNAVEVAEAVDYLTGGRREDRLHRVTLALAGEMLALGGLAADRAAGEAMAQAALDDGRAADRFAAMVAALGGPRDFLENWRTYLPVGAVELPVYPDTPGHLSAIDTRAVGVAVVALGGGRTKPSDAVDHAVGLTHIQPLGAAVGPDKPAMIVRAHDTAAAQAAADAVRTALTVAPAPPPLDPAVMEIRTIDTISTTGTA